MAGTTLLYNTVYGEPCTLELRSDGDLVGTAGYAGEDRDRGHWWTQDDRWYRQWHQWAYGEAVGFAVVVDGDHVRFYAEDGFMADTAVITRPPRRRSTGSVARTGPRSEEHTAELQSLMRISYAVFCLQKKTPTPPPHPYPPPPTHPTPPHPTPHPTPPHPP